MSERHLACIRCCAESFNKMDSLLVSAAGGMKTGLQSLDILANDIANTGTVAFKSDREFHGLYKQQLPVIDKPWTDFSQGLLTTTANQLNVGLAGKGFFALNSPGGIVYTRNGQFEISKTNQLQTAEGYTLRNTRDQGKPITVDPTQPIDIDKTGTVRQGGQELGQIEIDDVENPSQALRKLGNSYFVASTAGQQNPPLSIDTRTEVRQGTLEQSNVPTADSAVRLISVMRQFEMLQRAVSVDTEMNKEAIEQVARPS
jgi:flagellar basal-body rod protein FlgF